MIFRAIILCLSVSFAVAQEKAKDEVTRWNELRTKHRELGRQMMARRSAIMNDSEDAKVLKAQIRDLTKKIQELNKELNSLIDGDEEYKRLETSMRETQKALQGATTRRIPSSRMAPRPIAPRDPSQTSAPGPAPPPPPPPPPPPQAREE